MELHSEAIKMKSRKSVIGSRYATSTRFTSRNSNQGQARAAWLLGSPALILIFVFMLLPFIMSIGFSFTNKMLVQNINNPLRWTGFYNYQKLFQQKETLTAFLNTFKYALMVVPSILILATLLAISVNNRIKGIAVFRLIYFSPQVVSTIVVAIIWWFIFSPSSDGLLNSILESLGLGSRTWLKDPKLALTCISVMSIWQDIGMQMIIILGGLQFIPQELYEAATVDGCTRFQKMIHITLPLLKNTLNFVLITMTIASLKLFTQVYVLTEGGPQNKTLSIVYLMYLTGFTRSQVGYSSAMAVVFFILVLCISMIQNKLNTED